MNGVQLELLLHADHYPAVIDCVLRAQRSVWIATANLKELMVEDAQLVPGRRRASKRFRSVLSVFSELAARGVELRILHASLPSRIFQRDFDRQRALVQGGLQLRLCPRTHMKLVIVDGEHLYLGSANWTGAGIGAKHADRRNFELGLLTRDERLLDAAQETFEQLWRGRECAACRLREECPTPLDVFALKPPRATQPQSGDDVAGAARSSRARKSARARQSKSEEIEAVQGAGAARKRKQRGSRARKSARARQSKSEEIASVQGAGAARQRKQRGSRARKSARARRSESEEIASIQGAGAARQRKQRGSRARKSARARRSESEEIASVQGAGAARQRKQRGSRAR